ncbi:MAG: alpha/beta fold hydrolase [Microthrixaceae bacterium]
MTAEVEVKVTSNSLAARLLGAVSGDCVFVHGFAQNAQCLGRFGSLIAEQKGLLAVDAPGHGQSAKFGNARLEMGAELLCATAGSAHYIGYSMGGRLCLQAAVSHPELFQSLVLIGATAGIDDPIERSQRQNWDRQQAESLVEVGLDEFLDSWLEQPMFAGLTEDMRFHEERRSNTVGGLAASLEFAGTGSMTPLWDQLRVIRCPVLVITGSNDVRYSQIAERLVEHIGSNASSMTIASAGHAAHLEQPEMTAHAILEFLASSSR